eukprot:scaffold7620_cov277-Pinguiococcus_pyrenoidosus.AAC.1
MEPLLGIGSLGAQVVQLVAPCMVLFEEVVDVLRVVAVDALKIGRGKAHGDDPAGDVAEIEIVALRLEAPLLPRHDAAHPVSERVLVLRGGLRRRIEVPGVHRPAEGNV